MGLNETVPSGVDTNYYYESKVSAFLGISVFYMSLSTIAVALRFYARYLAGLKFWWDDYLCVCALPSIFVNSILLLRSISTGYGRHRIVMQNSDPTFVSDGLRILFVLIISYSVGLAIFKCAGLALYYRLFSVYNWFRVACFTLVSVICVWTIVIILLLVLRCDPIKSQWEPTPHRACRFDIRTHNLIITIPHISYSILILLLPQPLIWKLQLRPVRRVAVTAIFLLGAFDVGVAITRLIAAVHNPGSDISYDVELYYWSVGEITFGILSCCLPTYLPLLRAFSRHKGWSTPDQDGLAPDEPRFGNHRINSGCGRWGSREEMSINGSPDPSVDESDTVRLTQLNKNRIYSNSDEGVSGRTP